MPGERLLLCLDYYLDPYYKNTRCPMNQNSQNCWSMSLYPAIPVRERGCPQSLTSYAYPPFYILEQNLGQIEDQLMPDVMYALNMGRSDGLLYALLD